jgi:hypothetical protein
MTLNLDVRLEDGSVATVPGLGGLNLSQASGAAAAAAPMVIDTGFRPPPGQAAFVQSQVAVDDAVTPASAAVEDVVALKTSALGVLTISGAPANVAKVGTAALIAGAFATTYSVSAANTLVVTVTPPAAYPQALTAAVQLQNVVT